MKSYDFLEPVQLELEEEVRYFNDREESLGYEFARVSFPPLVGQFLTPDKLVNRSPEICSPWLLLSHWWGEEKRWYKADRGI